MMAFKKALIRAFHLEGGHVKLLLGFIEVKPCKLLTRVVYLGVPGPSVFVTYTIPKFEDHRIVIGRIVDIALFCQKYGIGCVTSLVIVDHQVIQHLTVIAFSVSANRISRNSIIKYARFDQKVCLFNPYVIE